MIKEGTEIICTSAIEGYITYGKTYIFEKIESYAGRVVIRDDQGREGHFKPERFIVPSEGNRSLQGIIDNGLR